MIEIIDSVGPDGRLMTPMLTDKWVWEMASRNHLPKEHWTTVVVYSETGEVVPVFIGEAAWPDTPMHAETIITITCAQDGQQWPCATRMKLDRGYLADEATS